MDPTPLLQYKVEPIRSLARPSNPLTPLTVGLWSNSTNKRPARPWPPSPNVRPAKPFSPIGPIGFAINAGSIYDAAKRGAEEPQPVLR